MRILSQILIHKPVEILRPVRLEELPQFITLSSRVEAEIVA